MVDTHLSGHKLCGGRPQRGDLSAVVRPFAGSELYRSDAYVVYDWLPANRHRVGKEPFPDLSRGSVVNRNEGLHSRWRDRLKQLQRKTKGYTKSVAMLRDSIALVALRPGLI